MITVKLMGGIGNQMFQYAAGRALALKNRTELTLDLSWFDDMTGCTPRIYELNVFMIDAMISKRNKSFLMNLKVFEKYYRKFYNRIVLFRLRTSIEERYFYYDPDVLELKDNVHLTGYWQSEKYFTDYESEIRKDFQFPVITDLKNKEMASEIKKVNSISIHVRRGDYVGCNVHGDICGPDYYRKAVSLISEKVENPEFFCFSDDMAWVKENITINYPVHYIDWNCGDQSFRDMHLMSLCRHNIIANSSFSWWGAWLNKNYNKVIIAPNKWFTNLSMDTKDLIPEGWIKL